MLNKIGVVFLVCVILMFGFTGCGQDGSVDGSQSSVTSSSSKETIPNICPLMVMIDGKLYHDRGYLRSDISIEDDDILGYITSIVSMTSLPKQNNEANYTKAENAPYARWNDNEYGEVYVIRYDNNWHVLLPAE